MTKHKHILLAALAAATLGSARAQVTEILNASYDVGREVFAAINEIFVPHYREATGRVVTVNQSHAGSSRQARAILEGLQADVVTFNQVTDVTVLANGGLVDENWNTVRPHNSSPFFSVHSILVRRGNPKNIRDWSDLANPGVEIVQVNPKTGGNGRYAVLAYYLYGLETNGGDAEKADAFLKSVLRNVVVFDQGGRAATASFTERNIGDVLVTFESEALSLAAGEDSPFEVVTPSVSALSEFPVALVRGVAARRGSVDTANAYLDFLFTPPAQRIAAENNYRPRDPAVLEAQAARFPETRAIEPSERFDGWDGITARFFANNALVDRLLAEIARENRR